MKKSEHILAVALGLVILVYGVNFGLLGFLIGPFDFDHLSSYWEIAWRFWRTQSLPPQFNPFLCGGRTLGGDPQLPIFHPFVLLVPILGPTWLIKLEMLGQLSLGSYALFRMLEQRQLNRSQVRWGLFLFLSGGGVVAKMMVGHVTLGFYFLFPLFLWLSYRLAFEPSLRVLALYWALFIYAGLYKPNFPLLALPPLFGEAAVRAFVARRPRILVAFLIGVVCCAVVNAVTYLPAWNYFSLFPRTDGSDPILIAPYTFLANFLLPLKAIPKAFYGDGYLQRHEYNFFLGPIALYWASKGLRIARPENRAEDFGLAALCLISLVLGFGSPSDQLGPMPYSWFRVLWPGFNSIRVPARFWFGVYLALIILSARGFRLPERRSTFWIWIVVGILPLSLNAAVNLFKVSVLARTTQWSEARAFKPDISLHHNHPDEVYSVIRAGDAIIDCVDNVEVRRPKNLRPGSLLEITQVPPFSTPFQAHASWAGWSHIKIQAAAPPPFEFSLNFNHSPLWRVETGEAKITSRMGEPLRILSRQERLEVTLSFEQPFVREAMGISLVGSLLFLGFLVTSRLRLKP